MRIIFFNIWHGQGWEALKDFLKENLDKTDIFCFLEVDPELQNKLEKLLIDFKPIYERGIKTDYLGGVVEGRSIFVKRNIKIISKGALELYKITPDDAGGSLFAELEVHGKKFLVQEVHGKTRPGNKLDTKERIEQSKRILEFSKDGIKPRIIGGDFNLMPGTKSIKMIEAAGYTNLIKEFGIKSTRNKISWEQFAKKPGFTKQYFADYVFVSPQIKVKNFEVPYNEVSDHLPLILDFEI